jgi:hypothetical protein
MDGKIWLFPAVMVALVMLALVLMALRRRPSGPDQQLRHCSSCQTPMSPRRVSFFESLTLRGAWICPHCGARMSKAGKRAGAAT